MFFSPDAADWRDLNYKDRGKRDAEEDEAAFRDDRQFQTKLFGDVEVVVKGKFPTGKPQPPCNRTSHLQRRFFTILDPRLNLEPTAEPLTLPPKLVRDKFAVQRNSVSGKDNGQSRVVIVFSLERNWMHLNLFKPVHG